MSSWVECGTWMGGMWYKEQPVHENLQEHGVFLLVLPPLLHNYSLGEMAQPTPLLCCFAESWTLHSPIYAEPAESMAMSSTLLQYARSVHRQQRCTSFVQCHTLIIL